jgi:hypothetical protein
MRERRYKNTKKDILTRGTRVSGEKGVQNGNQPYDTCLPYLDSMCLGMAIICFLITTTKSPSIGRKVLFIGANSSSYTVDYSKLGTTKMGVISVNIIDTFVASLGHT